MSPLAKGAGQIEVVLFFGCMVPRMVESILVCFFFLKLQDIEDARSHVTEKRRNAVHLQVSRNLFLSR